MNQEEVEVFFFFLFGTYKKQILKFVENLIYQNLQYQITLFDPWKSFQLILENFLDKNEQRGTLIRDPRVLVLSYYLRKPVSQSGLPLVGGMFCNFHIVFGQKKLNWTPININISMTCVSKVLN